MEDKTALVAEDNSEHYARYAALLSGMGLRVERACDGVGVGWSATVNFK